MWSQNGLSNHIWRQCYIQTCLCAHITDPRSFHDPPLRSIRTILNIWKNRSPLNDVAAKAGLNDPAKNINTIEIINIKSENRKIRYFKNGLSVYNEYWWYLAMNIMDIQYAFLYIVCLKKNSCTRLRNR